MDSLQKAVLATEILADKFQLDPIFLEALRTQSGDPFTRLRQQNDAMADALWTVAQAVTPSLPIAGPVENSPSPPTPVPSEGKRKTRR